jgi:hypothetical protein
MKSADVRRSARRVEVARACLLLAFAGLAIRAAHLAMFDQRGVVRGDAQSLPCSRCRSTRPRCT